MLIKVNIPEKPYFVRVGESLDNFGVRLREHTEVKNVFIITNNTVGPLYKDRLIASLKQAGFDSSVIELEDGEKYKNLDTMKLIYDRMSAEKIERFTPIIGLGGGVVGDIAGFAASTYLRGLPFYNIPTSLIAQVDSSVGGKTGVNLASGKNLVGTFYQPEYVHIDVELLKTLEDREYRSGQAEVIKHALIRGEEFLTYIENNIESILQKDKEAMEVIVFESVKIKGEIVEQDEREAGLRRVLNLGHTVGHGLEASMGYGYMRHGEGVAIGMVAASEIAVIMGKGDKELTGRIINLLKNFVLPVRIPSEASIDRIMDTMYLDKKVRNKNLEFVLPFKPGNVVPGIVVEEDTVIGVLEDLF